MKKPFSARSAILIAWLKKVVDCLKALFPSAKRALSRLVVRNISRVREWFEKNKHILPATIAVIAVVYFIPYTFVLGNRGKTVVGIMLQIIAGTILVIEQISSTDRIRDKVTEIIRQPLVLALLGTIVLFPFAVSTLTALGDVPSNRWSAAWGITVMIFMMFGMFLTSLMLLRRIKWLRRKDRVPIPRNRLDISDLSLRNVGILFGASVSVMILLIYFLRWLMPQQQPWLLMLWYGVFLLYGFTLLPLWIIGPLYFAAFGVARLAGYIRTKKGLEVWFWLFLFVLWAWGWLLLLLKEII